jgi:hypothetical protein
MTEEQWQRIDKKWQQNRRIEVKKTQSQDAKITDKWCPTRKQNTYPKL